MVRVLVTEPVHADALALLRNKGCEIVEAASLPSDEIAEAFRTADIILVRTRKLDPAEIGGARLRMISKHGVGVDNIPLDVARAAGIVVTNTPGANAGSVAEHALMLMLALAKALPSQIAAARADGLPDRSVPLVDLAGRRLLVVGYGRSGRRLAVLASALGMSVTVFSPRLTAATTPEGHRVVRSLDEALPETDVLSLHCPLTEATRGLIGAAELARMPRGAYVVNTARGGLIDEAALAAAATSGHLGGFAVDVVAEEPVRADNPLLSAPRGIVTPHSAAMTAEAFRQMGMDAAENILAFLEDRIDPANLVLAGRT